MSHNSCDIIVFFFSSRRRHTRCSRDWSSDVCSSDLLIEEVKQLHPQYRHRRIQGMLQQQGVYLSASAIYGHLKELGEVRSEERRVGKECRSRWSPYH